MPDQRLILKMFLASPSDVADERNSVESVVNEFNRTWGDKGIMIELIRWESHCHPSVGVDGQDVINEQVGNDYDIFVGIMSSKFGTPTARAGSGTEEEFNRAMSRRDEGQEVEIMFYFKNPSVPLDQIDPAQLEKVLAFRKQAEMSGVFYSVYPDSDEFATNFRIHLAKVVKKWQSDEVWSTGSSSQPSSSETYASAASDPVLSNLAAIEAEDPEGGAIELMEIASEAIGEVSDVLVRMTDAVTELNQKSVDATADANRLALSNPNAREVKRFANRTASHYDSFVDRMKVEIVQFNLQQTTAMENFGKAAMISLVDFDEDPNEVQELHETMTAYKAAILGAARSMNGMKESIFSLPRLTTAFNRARKRAAAVIDDLTGQFELAERQVDGALDLIVQIRDKGSGAQSIDEESASSK